MTFSLNLRLTNTAIKCRAPGRLANLAANVGRFTWTLCKRMSRAAVFPCRIGRQKSTTPNFFAALALNVLPDKMIPQADAPINLGKRIVPPQPGWIPNITSGKPRRVALSSMAMRKLQANASSRPPPRQKPLINATLGRRKLSSLASTNCPRRMNENACSVLSISENCLISAPAIKPDAFADAITKPTQLSSSSITSSISSNSCSIDWSRVFTEACCLSKSSQTILSSSLLIWKCLNAPYSIMLSPQIRFQST